MTDSVRVSPLDAQHRSLGAKMVPCGGWEMPLAYPSGTIAEHLACRADGVVFDVSHLGTVRVTGDGALAALQWAFTNDLNKIGPGRAQYTHLLDPLDASIVDDIIVWWLPARDGASDRFDVMPNASNTAGVVAALGEAIERTGSNGSGRVTIHDTTATRAVLAVQGPGVRERLLATAPAAAVGRFRVDEVQAAGVSCTVAGTGYTGEDGVEIAVPAGDAASLWNALLAAGLLPAGLGARDTLRLEAGLPLHGHELTRGTTTFDAGLGWVIGAKKVDFRGRAALAATTEAEASSGPRARLVGLSVTGRQPAREGAAVRASDGAVIGKVSSGNFAPSLGHAVAMAYLAPTVGVGDEVGIDVRGRVLAARVVRLPFLPPRGR